MHDEKKLLVACQNNDRLAHTAFYDFYKRKMMGVCSRYARTNEEAEDILQEAFLKIFKNINQIQRNEAVGAWVRTIVVNTAIDFYKKNLKHSQNIDYQQVGDFGDDSFKQIYTQIDIQELLKAINELADGYRMVLNMYIIDGFTHNEIAAKLDISEGTSKSQLFRAKSILQNKLKANYDSFYEKCEL